MYKDLENNLKKISAKIIIIACNGIGTPRLLLLSKNKYFKNGLANSSGLVGKNLMLHPLGFIEGKFPEFLNSILVQKAVVYIVMSFMKPKKVIISKGDILFKF